MRNRCRKSIACGAGASLIVALTVGCGGGGGGGRSDTSTVNGNVSSASASIQPVRRSWLAWANEELLGFAKRVFAQASTALDGVQVQAGGEAEITDPPGGFAPPGAAPRNVNGTLCRGDVPGEVGLPHVGRESVGNL